MEKFMKIVGGKRGIAVIIGAVVTVAVQFGWITADVAEKISGAAAALGLAGIVHHNFKA